MNDPINYSIIIPHKNIPKLLRRCLDSIPRRKDVQIIIVDDNSDPGIVDFEQFPGLNDPFIEVVFTKEGKGAGYARNVGLTKAVGRWLLFADADDFFNYCMSEILDEYINSVSDIVYFKHNSADSDTYMPKKRATSHNNRINHWFNSPKKSEPLLRFINTAVWARLYKAEFIKRNNILFDEVSISNDVTFAYLTGYYAASISADRRALYCTTIRKNSIRHSKRNTDNVLDIFFVDCKRYRFYMDHNIPIYKKFLFAKLLFKFFYSNNKNHFKTAKKILFDFDITLCDIIMLTIYDIIILTPRRILDKLLFRF